MLTRTLRGVPLDTIDQRSQVGVALRRVRDDLTHQIGEPTAAERILIEEVAKARVIAEAVGQYILRQESLVRADDPGELLPVVLQHSGLVANLTRMLHLLGLRRHQKAKTLHDFIAARQP